MGASLARRGYRPVPLYNAIPFPFDAKLADPETFYDLALVPVVPVIAALRECAGALGKLQLSDDAPPAFLLDARRAGFFGRAQPGEFDNRSVCFRTDFPSPLFLESQGIERVLLVRTDPREPAEDLQHVLRGFQDGNLSLWQAQLGLDDAPAPLSVEKPAWYGAMFQRALLSLGLRRAASGGFGRLVPHPSSG
ncbi:MAG: hypothetical protein QM756_44565 [Polyangiaceae bacterium]